MIDKQRFYSDEDSINNTTKKVIWKNIRKSIDKNKVPSRILVVDLRSFAYGIAFSVLILITALSAVKLYPQLFPGLRTEDVIIKNAYKSAADELEKSLPKFVNSLDESERIQELLNVRMDELNYINKAIRQYNIFVDNSDVTSIKEMRLIELYQLKIDIINRIIKLKDETWL